MKAIALFSGGLDSLLSIKLIQEAGITVEAVNFSPPYLTADADKKRNGHLLQLIGQLNVKLHIIKLGQDYLCMLEAPKHGYGRAFNPCLDCHIFFLRKAKEMMGQMDASFLVTGEVLGQRPKSQFSGAFPVIDREVGLEGYIVRPLSARLLPETVPEKKGWISLKHCPSISGRDRKIQLHMAEKYHLQYETPAGGCLLTNEIYGRKVQDFLKNDGRLTSEQMQLLALGRHFRFSPNFKGIIGRNEKENDELFCLFFRQRRKKGLSLLKAGDAMGPYALGQGCPSGEDLFHLAALVARYSDLPPGEIVPITLIESGHSPNRQEIEVTVNKDQGLSERFRIE